MSDDRSHGSPRNPRTWSPNEPPESPGSGGSGRPLVLFTGGLLITALAGALIVVAMLLKTTREDFWKLQDMVAELQKSPAAIPSTVDDPAVEEELTSMRKAQEDLRDELSKTLAESTQSLRQASRDAQSERRQLLHALTGVLLRSETGKDEVSALLSHLTPQEREAILDKWNTQNEENGSSDEPPSTPESTDSGTGGSGKPLPAIPVDDPETPPSPSEEFIEYTVKRGDSLSKIAHAHGVSQERLMTLNGISNPNHLNLDQVLKIPKP